MVVEDGLVSIRLRLVFVSLELAFSTFVGSYLDFVCSELFFVGGLCSEFGFDWVLSLLAILSLFILLLVKVVLCSGSWAISFNGLRVGLWWNDRRVSVGTFFDEESSLQALLSTVFEEGSGLDAQFRLFGMLSRLHSLLLSSLGRNLFLIALLVVVPFILLMLCLLAVVSSLLSFSGVSFGLLASRTRALWLVFLVVWFGLCPSTISLPLGNVCG
ncbi:unnamed protein product [Arabis nemorensis]|uniref:Transmembrane protein n=1 Tax=Arabis nemorensis TaxID=586526 RepID=A0A565CRT4_9BRAS|nr:unnamed protein product [Arabis nemorensis]